MGENNAYSNTMPGIAAVVHKGKDIWGAECPEVETVKGKHEKKLFLNLSTLIAL